MRKKRISVCLASYNGEAYIRQQIDSILNQLGENDELVVSDDCSTDSTIDVVSQIADPRINLIPHTINRGYTRNFESALEQASGQYVFLSDQDDVWLPGKVETMLRALQDCDLAISDCRTTDSALEVLSESRFNDFNIKRGFARHLVKCRYVGCCMAFRSELLHVLLPFPPRDDLVEHDAWIAAMAELYFRVDLIATPLLLYRRHSSNTSLGGFDRGYSILNKVCRRLYRLFHLFARREEANRIASELRG